jgi:hypothetical protein
MNEAGLVGIGKLGISGHAMVLRWFEQRGGCDRDPFTLACSAAGGAMQRA